MNKNGFSIIAVTKRLLCGTSPGAFLAQIEAVAAVGVTALILREKDLSPPDYEALSRQTAAVCARHGIPFIPHNFIESARTLNCGRLHLSWETFRLLAEGKNATGSLPGIALGVSVHSVDEAKYAADRGAAWLIAGHVFPTDCKKGLEARGIEFLSGVCAAAAIPVYGIGGITEGNIALVPGTGAAGVCLMSSLIESKDPAGLLERLRIKFSSFSNASQRGEIEPFRKS
jgi:thiamine-phosphate pyrophosphorylase